MKKTQISFNAATFVVKALKDEAKKRNMSLSEFIYQLVLKMVLRKSKDRLGLTDPETGKICEIIKKEDDPEYFDAIKNPDFTGCKTYSSLEEFEKDLELEG